MFLAAGALIFGDGRAMAAQQSEDSSGAAPSEADLMYRAMKRSSRESKDDVAIDRAIERARTDSEHRKRALREANSAWRDPFADPPDRSERVDLSGGGSQRQKPVSRRTEEELRAARSEAARARWEAASARADAAAARAEAADAKVEAARAEREAARVQFAASRSTCGVLSPPPKSPPRRSTVARGSRDELRPSGEWMPAMRRAVAHEPTQRRFPAPTKAAPAPTPPPIPAPMPPIAASPPRVASATAARPAPTSGFIVVPIPPAPAPEPERARRRP